MAKDRVFYIDFLKAIGIVLVVLGHIYRKDDNFYNFIYSFHMPLFFFLSGVFFQYETANLKTQLKRRVHTLITPYLFFYITTYLYWVLVESNLRSESGGVVAQWWEPIIGLFYSSPYWNFFAHNNPLWFIPALFSIELLACATSKLKFKYKIVIGVVLFFISLLCSKYNILLPFGLIMSFFCFIFYLLGSKLFIINQLSRTKLKIYFYGLLLIYIFIIWGHFHPVNIFQPSFTNSFIFHIIALYTIILFTLFAKIIEPILKKDNINKVISFIGLNTLVILCIHDPLKRVIIFCYSRITDIPIETIRTNIIHSFICLIICFLLLYPLIVTYNSFIKRKL